MSSTEKKKWPFGFYVCSLSFTFERLAYYAAKWGVAVFVVVEAASGGLGLSQAEGAIFSSQLVAWTYITPVIGGYIADRWVSPQLMVPIGDILMGLGYLCAWQAHGKGMVWAMIILVALGTGCFKGVLSGINGRLFPLADADTLDSVFNIQYMFVNIGVFIGTTFLPLIATKGSNGYRTMFLVCGIALFVDFAWWMFGKKALGDAGRKPFLVDNRVEKEVSEADKSPMTKLEKNRVIAIIIVTLCSGIFWLFWYETYMPVYYQFGPASQGGDGWASWMIGNFEMPTSWFDSMNAILCIVLCPVFAGVWAKMKQRPKGDWSMFTKTALGIIILGGDLVMMVIGAIISGEGTKDPVGIWVIILTAICMSVGEIIFSPLGNAFINKYSPKKVLGTMLGVWPLVIFFAGQLYGPLYNWLCGFSFVKAYGAIAVICIVFGAVMILFSKKFDKAIGATND